MFNKLFALLFKRKKPQTVADPYEPSPQCKDPRCFYDNPDSLGFVGQVSTSRKQSQVPPLLPDALNPVSAIGFISAMTYDGKSLSVSVSCGNDSSNSYGSGSSCDTSSSSSEQSRRPAIVAILQRELKTAQRWCTCYRRLALLGWLAFVGALLWQPSAHADTLPAGSLACADAATWAEQQNQTMFEPAVPGCVYTYHDFDVTVEVPGVVWIGDLRVWVYAAAVQP